MLGKVLSTPSRQLDAVDDDWIKAAATKVIATVAQSRATWQRHHVVAEAHKAGCSTKSAR